MIKVYRFFLLLFLTLVICMGAQQQPVKNKTIPITTNVKDAKDNFGNGNYKGALADYLALQKKEPDNVLYNYRTAICYLNLNVDRSLAIPYLEKVIAKEKENKDAWFQLGSAYQYAYKFDEAIGAFKKFKEIAGNKPLDEMEKADRQIEICNHAKELMKFPIKVKFDNMGNNINSEYADYFPFVSENESAIFFNTRRKGTVGGFLQYDGTNTSDIFSSSEKLGIWSKAKNAGVQFNSDGDDEITSLTNDGTYAFIYSENELEFGDVLVAIKKGKLYQQRGLLEAPINTKSIEAAATTTSDGTLVVFSSDRSGGEGDFDLYSCRKLPTGQWGVPVNLGKTVNTKYSEDFPNISADGKTLYFCSQGHTNMGGFDIFKSTWDESKNEWTPAINIGYPLNTPEDNMTISFSTSGRHAYVSAYRKEGKGDLDIYRVTISNAAPNYTIIKGTVKANFELAPNEYLVNCYKKGEITKEFPVEFNPDASWKLIETKKNTVKEGFEMKYTLIYEKGGSEKMFDLTNYPKNDPNYTFKEIRSILGKKTTESEINPKIQNELKGVLTDQITLIDKSNGETFGTYKTIGKNGSFIIIAPPGEYELKIAQNGFEPYTENISVIEKSITEEVQKDILLKKK